MKNFPICTFTLIGLCTLIFFLEFVLPLDSFAFVPSLAFERPWTFVTSIFLHANFSHLFFNMFALFMFGIYLEAMVKPKKYLIVFFLAGIVGNIGYMVTTTNPNTAGIGASGAIYGLMGALVVLKPSLNIFFGGVMMPLIIAAILWAAIDLLGFFTPDNIAHAAHLSGLFIGVSIGFYIKSKIKNRNNFIYKKFY